MTADTVPAARTSPLGVTRAAQLAALVTAAHDRARRANHCPFDGSVIGEVPICMPGDVTAAVARARAAQRDWVARPMRERTAVARRYHDLVLARQEELLDLVQLESGKSRASAHEEVSDLAATAIYYARTAAIHLRSRWREGAVPFLTTTVVHHHPKGVVGIISPWNYPLTLATSDALPALLAGNGVVLKPDRQTPFTALAAVELLYEAGLPRDLFQVVTGEGPVLGPTIIGSVDFLMFTGSTATGRIIAEQCGRRLIGFSAELGGKNPMIVLADADIKAAARHAVHACFSNSGQLCISIERIYVEEAVYDRFAAAFAGHVRAMRLAPGLDWDADMGSMVSEAQLEIVGRHVGDAVAKGARVLAGGRARPDLGPLFFEPTVLEGVTEDMEVAHAETFGPVVSLYRVRDEAEAIARANDSEYGLNAAIWSSARHGSEVAPRLQVGTANVNEGFAAAWGSFDAPMGGWKASGVGRRHGREGIVKYTETQTVAVQRAMTIRAPHGMGAERWASLMSAGLKVLKYRPNNGLLKATGGVPLRERR
ncbi:MAG: succinic semialdehyde dehydrogenase [Actinomycetota bacterium]